MFANNTVRYVSLVVKIFWRETSPPSQELEFDKAAFHSMVILQVSGNPSGSCRYHYPKWRGKGKHSVTAYDRDILGITPLQTAKKPLVRFAIYILAQISCQWAVLYPLIVKCCVSTTMFGYLLVSLVILFLSSCCKVSNFSLTLMPVLGKLRNFIIFSTTFANTTSTK